MIYHTVVVWLSVHPLWQYNRKRLLFVLWQWGTCHTFQLSARNVIVCATALYQPHHVRLILRISKTLVGKSLANQRWIRQIRQCFPPPTFRAIR